MVYEVTKKINGSLYRYQVKAVRTGKQVQQQFVQYLGPVAAPGSTPEGNIAAGAQADTRTNAAIAKDINKNSKKIVENVDDWKKAGVDKADLKY
jgi:hypothetical protein